MTIKIDKKIVGYSVVKPDDAGADAAQAPQEPAEAQSNVIQLHEKIGRPQTLQGATYKIKTPLTEHALYVTINDIILNEGTEHELRRPFEIFINSKNMDHFQWIVALTRIISAVFRKGGDVTFLVEELRSVFDPRGGYFKKGGKFTPSLVAEIGDVIDHHLRIIGLIKDDDLDEHQKKFVQEKRAEYQSSRGMDTRDDAGEQAQSDYPEGATLCIKCNTKAMIMMDGCLTCLNCGDSKCG